jgi:peptidoglycan/LPS O-acetylase OafA/YrhL
MRTFLWARFCRIYPALLFTTAVFVMVFIPGRVHLSAGFSLTGQLTANIFLMQVPWLNAVIINQPSWSISAEFYAYSAFHS